MAEFNPDKFLAETDTKQQAFDPDKFLSDTDPNNHLSNPGEESGFKSFTREAVKGLPLAGSLIGGSLSAGAATVPTLGSLTAPSYLAGSALGAAGGKALQTMIEENYLGAPKKDLSEKLIELPKEAAYDVAGNITGEKIIGPIAHAAGSGLKKVASGLSGIPEQVIGNYAKNAKAIGEIHDIPLEADRIRQAAQDSIKGFKNIQNTRISQAIADKADLPVDISKTRQALVGNLEKVNPEINPEVAKKIQKEIDLIDHLSSRSSSHTEIPGNMQPEGYDVFTQPDLFKFSEKPKPGFNAPRGDDLYPLKQNMELDKNAVNAITNQGYQGTISGAYSTKVANNDILVPAKDAYQIQKRLQDLAEYLEPGQIFKKKDFADLTFKKAAANTRQSLQQVVPEISQANAELSKIYGVSKNLNKNLISPEKPMNAMMSVGAGQNPIMENQLSKLGQITGQDYISPMQNLASAQRFNSPDLISAMTTGRANIPVALAGMVGGGVGGAKGAALGLSSGLISTPIGIKASIGAGNMMSKMGATPQKIGSELMQFYGPEIQQSIQNQLPQMPPPTPYQVDQQLKHSSDLSPSQKAKARLQNNRLSK